jgi:hypothetical protein
MSQYGFIITRHVNSEKTNKYWNRCVKQIKKHYPLRKIVIIDDNSNQLLVSPEPDLDMNNVTTITSEFPGRGELLPYYYLLKYRWFPNAVIIHDSLFIHKKIHFEHFKMPVMPLWHEAYDKENLKNIVRITAALVNNRSLIGELTQPDDVVGKLTLARNNFNLCFGGQCYIKLPFLDMLQRKYGITNLVNVVHNRPDRCALERVLGLLFCKEFPKARFIGSLFGRIYKHPRAFHYRFEDYVNDIRNRRRVSTFTKVWTGR